MLHGCFDEFLIGFDYLLVNCVKYWTNNAQIFLIFLPNMEGPVGKSLMTNPPLVSAYLSRNVKLGQF
jgi:hypothetical protein